jgi:pimeloyl-ACP methyl ester carboxylesterase
MTARIDLSVGRYVHVPFEGKEYRTYYEESGSGIPLVCLHTAGTDSREYAYQLNDPEITKNFRVIAFDMPWHGRSLPPAGWQRMEDGEYQLTSHFYTNFVMAFCAAVGVVNPVVMGSSMGGNVCLPLAHQYGDGIRALIPLEAADHSPGWVSNALWDPRCHGGEVAGSYVMGEISPTSPDVERWETWWFYATGGPGVFKGDVFFYSDDHDYRPFMAEMTNTPPMYFMTGEYDGACKPWMSKATADQLPNATFLEMKDIGHFPMCENHLKFKEYLTPVLDHILSGANTVDGFSWPHV